jgi:preprotein translocase subunit SecY
MKNFIATLQHIWKIEDLRKRILLTLAFILIYRLGSFVILPGINAEAMASANVGGGGLGEILALFTGGAFSRASVFALGIMPYISASIIMQLLGIAIPSIQKMQKEGESGRQKINQTTRFLTIAITAVQAPSYLASTVVNVPGAVANPSLFWWVSSVIILTSGTLFIMWLGERITEKGIGNGISLIIMIGIIARLPAAFIQEFVGRIDGAGGMVMLLVEIVVLLLIIGFTVALVQAVRRVPVQYAKRISGIQGMGSGARQFIPLKVNAAGVMPIIFAQAIMFIPLYLAQAINEEPGSILIALGDIQGVYYNILFAVVIILFTYFYTAITVNPTQMADDLKRNGGFIPGIKPGKSTSEFLDTIISRITLPGAIFTAFIAIIPSIAMAAGIKQGFAIFYGGTSLLIIVGVVLDTLQQIESHLLMRHYDGLMKSGKVRGRSTSAVSMAG